MHHAVLSEWPYPCEESEDETAFPTAPERIAAADRRHGANLDFITAHGRKPADRRAAAIEAHEALSLRYREAHIALHGSNEAEQIN